MVGLVYSKLLDEFQKTLLVLGWVPSHYSLGHKLIE